MSSDTTSGSTGDGSGPEQSGPDVERSLTVYGRQGSPTVSIALPFSRINVNDDAELRAAVCELADLVARLAAAGALPRSEGRTELVDVADRARELLERLAT